MTPSHEFDIVTWFDPGYFLICFLWGYHSLMTPIMGLTVNPSWLQYFLCFFNWFFFNFILQHWVNWNNLFLFIFLWGYLSHDSCCGFGRLTRVGLVFFCPFLIEFFFQFCPKTLGWLGIEFLNLFWFDLYGVIMVSCLVRKFNRVTLFNPSYWSNILSSRCIYKKKCHFVKLSFYLLSVLFLNLSS
jgi:hypothetical protein